MAKCRENKGYLAVTSSNCSGMETGTIVSLKKGQPQRNKHTFFLRVYGKRSASSWVPDATSGNSLAVLPHASAEKELYTTPRKLTCPLKRERF